MKWLLGPKRSVREYMVQRTDRWGVVTNSYERTLECGHPKKLIYKDMGDEVRCSACAWYAKIAEYLLGPLRRVYVHRYETLGNHFDGMWDGTIHKSERRELECGHPVPSPDKRYYPGDVVRCCTCRREASGAPTTF